MLVSSEIGSKSEVLAALKKIDAVEEAYMVYGIYDFIVKIKAHTTGELKEIITWKVRRLNKVRSATTMIVTEERK